MKYATGLLLIFISQVVFAGEKVPVPGTEWGFSFESPKLINSKGNADKNNFQYAASSDDGFVISIFVEPSKRKETSAKRCMNYYWTLSKKNPYIVKNSIEEIERATFPMVVYDVEVNYEGKDLIQINADLYEYKDDKCIDVHISQTFASQEQVDYFNISKFVQSLKIYND